MLPSSGPATPPSPDPAGAPAPASEPAGPAVAPDQIAVCLDRLRTTAPLVHVVTNAVVTQLTANTLLAVGASPFLVDNPHEAAEMTTAAHALLVNLGTPHEATVAAMSSATEAAHAAGTPWVLDPVGVGALTWRTGLAAALLDRGPAVVRGNASEVRALAGAVDAGRGVDAAHTVEQAAPAARTLARRHRCAVAVSGPVDLVTDGGGETRVANGHAWLARTTGAGCALGALVAACAAVAEPAVAAVAATALLTVAAEDAAASSRGPGTFAAHLLDGLAGLGPERVAARAALS